MNKKTGMLAGLALLVVGSSAQAALLGRVPLTPGGTDYQAYYDTELNITWLADANAGAGSIYDDGESDTTDGVMTWYSAMAWTASLNTASYLGVNNWRLPFVVDSDGPDADTLGDDGGDWSDSGGTDSGYNVQTKIGTTVYSEMAHLYYVTLGNLGLYDTSGNLRQLGWGQNNIGPFSNVGRDRYWSGTSYAPVDEFAWAFHFNTGGQGVGQKGYASYGGHAWAVRDGDIGAVPVPAAGWLFASALGLMGMARRKGRISS